MFSGVAVADVLGYQISGFETLATLGKVQLI